MCIRIWLLIVALTVPFATKVEAHHSLADYDLTHVVTVTGTVTKLEWMNPHAWLYVDSGNAKDGIEHWSFEFGSPSESIRRGWTRQDLKNGDTVTVTAVVAKRGGNVGSARSIKLPNGKEVFTGARKE
jgi:hypothetical protein